MIASWSWSAVRRKAFHRASALVAAAFLVSCGGREEEAERGPSQLTVFFSSDTRGYLEPCACAAGMVGGLARRATYLESEPVAGARLLVDAGNMTKGSREDEIARFRFILDGMETLSYDAANLGGREAAIPAARLLEALSGRSISFVSANVLSATTGRPITEAYTILERSGLRIGVTGVTRSDVSRVGEGLRLEDPAAALLLVLPELRQRCDFVVCLAAVEEAWIRDLAGRAYEVDLFLGGDVTASQAGPERIGETLAAWVGDKGKYVGKVNILAEGDGTVVDASGAVTELTEDFADSPVMMPVLEGYFAYLEANLFARFASDEHLEVIGGRDPEAADRYIGSQGCGRAGCHQVEYAIWQSSRHARALTTLEMSEDQFDSACLPCHVAGFSARDGFQGASETPHLGGVQCEACHGRARNHVKQAVEGANPGEFPSLFRVITPNTCAKCHDRENSPEFEFAAYWERIKH